MHKHIMAYKWVCPATYFVQYSSLVFFAVAIQRSRETERNGKRIFIPSVMKSMTHCCYLCKTLSPTIERKRSCMILLGKKGVNWPSNLASHNRILNEESKEELGWKSPFEVYFGRKSNILVKASLENVADLNDCIIKAPKRKDYRRHFRNAKKLRKTAQLYSKRMNERMVVYNPNGDGNCQFEACRFWLQTLGIYHSVEAVREEIVQCLTQNPDNVVGIPLVHFAAMPWDHYLASMALDGEYGDQITLHLRFSTLRFLLFPPLVQTQQQLLLQRLLFQWHRFNLATLLRETGNTTCVLKETFSQTNKV